MLLFFFLKIYVFYFMLFCLDVCMYILFMSGAQGSQNRALDPLELESWEIVSHHVCTGTQT